jgi:DNA invertase Pin-like site-specific DNA recombinase
MTDNTKIKSANLQRTAVVYVRQSTTTQLERNPESTDRQYKLVDRALTLGWTRPRIVVIDEDLGRSASGKIDRSGFDRLAAEVALSHVGIVLGLEVSRLARNNADWYRLLDLCGMTDTLIADGDGLYHPADFNDRLVLGLKGTMSEAELHVLRARLNGGIRNKAARGELRRGLPIGFVWGEADGDIRFHPNEAVVGAVRTVFDRFAEVGSARQVWLWFRSQKLTFPSQSHTLADIRWASPTYTALHHVLTNPVYAGAYTYGKTRREHYVDDTGHIRQRTRHLPRAEWAVFIPRHHPGFISWDTYQTNQARLAANTRPKPHQAGGAVREGAALLQGLATCGRCGRKLKVYYDGKKATPGYHCPGSVLTNGRSNYCLRIGGVQIDAAVAKTFLATVTPAGIDAALAAEQSLDAQHDHALAQGRLEVERLRYESQRAERRYRCVEPENRLVARGLETEWEIRLRELTNAEAEFVRRENDRPKVMTPDERNTLRALGTDIPRVWSAPSTSDRDRKELLRTLLEEVKLSPQRERLNAHLLLRWRGGAVTELDVPLPRRQSPLRTDEETVALLRRLAVHYTDAVIAGILNRQGRLTAHHERFTVVKVASLRQHWKIPRPQTLAASPSGEIVTIDKAAEILNVYPSTIHRWLADGFIPGEQITPGAPWRIRMTDELKAKFVDAEIPGYVPMIEATKRLGVTRQTVLHRVKSGQLQAVLRRHGKRKGLRIKVTHTQPTLFDPIPSKETHCEQ